MATMMDVDMIDIDDGMDWSCAPDAKTSRSSSSSVCPSLQQPYSGVFADARPKRTIASGGTTTTTNAKSFVVKSFTSSSCCHDPFAKVNPFGVHQLSSSSSLCASPVEGADTVESVCASPVAQKYSSQQEDEGKEDGELVVLESEEFELDPAFSNAPEVSTSQHGATTTSREPPRYPANWIHSHRKFLTPFTRRTHPQSSASALQDCATKTQSPYLRHHHPQAYATIAKRLVQYADIAVDEPASELVAGCVDHLPLAPHKYIGCDSYIGPGPTNEVGDLLGGLVVNHKSRLVQHSDRSSSINSEGNIRRQVRMDIEQRRDRGPRHHQQRNNHGGRGGGYDNRRRQFNGNFRRDGGGGGDRFQGGGGQNRKRRHDDSGDDREERRPMKQRYEEPVASRLRREILVVGESVGSGEMSEVAAQIGKRIADNFEDDQVSGLFLDQVIQLIAEQPLKISILAAIFLYANESNDKVVKQILERAAERAQDALEEGNWREVKLMLRFFACLQGVLTDDGIFPVLDDLFNKAADLQTASQDDVIGFELVKIVLLTLPYAMASNATGLTEKAGELLEKTEIIATAQHPFENLAEPYPIDGEEKPFSYRSALRLLQEQSQSEANNGWSLACLPRIYGPTKTAKEEDGDDAMNGSEKTATKHALPTLTIPAQAHPGSKPLFPETFFSIYADQAIESTPGTSAIAASLIRDAVVDTINILDINRHSVAKYLIELDNYFAPGTFIKRATSFDKLKDVPEGQSTWKTEDMAIDSVFSQIFLLPQAEHKLVYYHGVITEACKLAPGAIAPTLGRAIRFLFRHIDSMDLELANRFLDWFSHHLSNFDFRWKWTEWTDYVDAAAVAPKHAFILAAIDKEIRLSFTKRIRDTLPPEYHKLIAEGKLKDTPDFKYKIEGTPYASEGQQILSILRKKAPEADIEPVIESIQSQAAADGVEDTLVTSTDAYMTSVCHIGSKSLSHVLSCIDRCKERLLAIGAASEPARRQIIQSVVDYWKDLPGVAVNIIDKLLNFTIVTPESVLRWCLSSDSLRSGIGLADAWRFEMLAATMGKITNRMRQIVAARVHAHKVSVAEEQIAMLDDTIVKEREGMRTLFALITEMLQPYVDGSAVADGMHDADDSQIIQAWAQRWTTAFQRKLAVEETVVGEAAIEATLVLAKFEAAREEARRQKEEEEREKRRIENEERRRKQEEEEQRIKKEKEAEEERKARENGNSSAAAVDGGVDALDVADDDV